ncbi:MAG: ATP synthase F0 subunit C [Holophagales bacterium]|jgi:F-type H+-transporting ATPase subunit c|nr:ATP synthase F0 subunit C [Holophagales bacterium]
MIKKLLPAASVVGLALLLPNLALAQEAARMTGGGVGWGHLSAALVLAIGAAAGATAQGRTAVAACDGMARNPGAAGQIRGIAFLGLVLIESLVIYTLVIAFLLYGK